jgi:uncharacterized protein YbjQ (UPF0145 family)
MKILRQIGSLVFVSGLFTFVFVGVPWFVITSEDPVIPLWLRVAIFGLLGGILLVLVVLGIEQLRSKTSSPQLSDLSADSKVLLLNSTDVPGREVTEILGLVQGHTVFAIWLGNDLSALMRLILGGELTEYTEMMGQARATAMARMIARAEEEGADAIINVRYMTTSVVGSAAELLTYGTAVKLGPKIA